MKVEDIKKAFEGKVESFNEFNNPDGSVGVMSFDLNKVDVSISFDYDTKEATTIPLKLTPSTKILSTS